MLTVRTKQCNTCHATKSIEDFHIVRTRQTGTVIYNAKCKTCYNTHYIAKWHAQTDEQKRKEIFKRKAKHNSDWFKDYRLKHKYNITLDVFKEMYDNQRGICYICQKLTPEDKIRVDHNHTTGAVRKLICHNCNTLLGHAKEDISTLLSAIEYIKEHNDNFSKT